jgi:tetratricopeptide (TPR) repeat protein
MQEDGTNSLSVDTGGFAIRNENNFGRALDAIQRDAGVYYVVSYAATNEKFDGKYRAIAVKVKRPDVTVRARRGYLAIAPARMLKVVPLTAPAAVPEMTVVPASLETAGVPVVLTTPGTGPAAVSDSKSAVSDAVRARVTSGKIALSVGATATNSGAAEAGWAAYERGDVETAAHELTKAAAAPDAQAWVHYVLGMSHLALQRYRDASQSWERVRQMAPQFEPVYFNLADAYLGQKEEGTAIKVLRDAEQRWPADAEIANAIGVIQVRRGALDSAIESFTHATTLSPSDGLGYFNLGRAHQMRLLKRQRYNPQAQRWLGGEDDKRKAIANFQKYIELGGPYVQQAQDALKALGWS